MSRSKALFIYVCLAVVHSAPGMDAERLWSAKIQPLFDVQCVKCHGPIEQKGGLELDTPQAVLKGGDDGAVIVPGKPEDSPLYKKLAPEADPHMPPKKQLNESERELVHQWIVSMQTAENVAGRNPSTPASTTNIKELHFDSVTAAIDSCLKESWERQQVIPAPILGERAWCRRVYLDLAGRIPSCAEVEAFLASPSQTRKEELVDRLLASTEYPVRMREWWDTFLMGRVKRNGQEDKRRQNNWWNFLELSFRSDRPWNETVRAFLTARSDKPEDKGSTWFLYERKNEHQLIAEAVAPVIYGTRIDCAQCHDHPLAREIKQAHYWGLVTAFNRSKNVEGTNGLAESAVGGYANFTNLKKESQPALVTLLTGKTLSESWISGDKKEEDQDDKYHDPKAKIRVPKYSRREAFAEAATQANPLLAKAFVNRMWAALLGRGIVHPADEINARNAPSHPELLEWLAHDFAANGYKTRRFIRGVVLSQAYALSAGGSQTAPDLFASAIERPLTGEQIARSWAVALGLPPASDAVRRAVIAAIPEVLPKEYSTSYQQAQFLTHSPTVHQLLASAEGAVLEKVTALPDTTARATAAFKAVYDRSPDPEELSYACTFLEQRQSRTAEAVRDLFWSLLCSAEFLTMPR